MIIKTDVYIDNILLPRCSEGGVSITPNKLYASNSGRSPTTGDFVGDIVAIKHDINLKWDMLKSSEFDILSSLSDTLQVEHDVRMMFDGKEYTTKTCYIADLPRTIKMQRKDGTLIYTGITMHIVEV